MRTIIPYTLTRRRMVAGLASLTVSITGDPLHANPLPHGDIDQPVEGLPTLDAIIIVHDDRVEARDLQQQLAILHDHGVSTHTITATGDLDKGRFLDLLHQCETTIAEERRQRPSAITAVMAWCDVANSLRELPEATSADIAIAHLVLFSKSGWEDADNVPPFVREGRDELVVFALFPHQFKETHGILQEGAVDHPRARQRFHLFVTSPADSDAIASPLVPTNSTVAG